jgi:pyruvate dehydrogenase E2 component (dihydrolipoamide acetyltransferase)
VGEATQGLQDTAGQAVDQVGQTAEDLAPAIEEATEQTQGALGQAAQGVQDTAQQAAQQTGQEQEAAEQQQSQATSGASQKAEELGVDLSEVEGTGPDGRITLKDVKDAKQG